MGEGRKTTHTATENIVLLSRVVVGERRKPTQTATSNISYRFVITGGGERGEDGDSHSSGKYNVPL